MLEIEKNVPIPKMHNGHGQYPWKDMEVGDSFLVPDCPDTNHHNNRASAGCVWAAKRFGMKFCTRKEGEGRRVWRIA